MAFRLIPREEKFYADFIALADRIVSGATLLEKMLATDPPAWDMGIEIKQVEEACDSLTHEIIQRLNRTFVTPIDREDIYQLAKSLDDVMDAIDAAAAVVRRYRISADAVRRPRAGLAHLALGDAGQGRRRGAGEASRASTTAPSRSTAWRTPPTRCTTRRCAASSSTRRTRSTIIKCKEMLDLLEQATDALRGRGQRPRERRRQARVDDVESSCRRRSGHRRRARLRLHQRLPRRRQLDRDRRVDARAVAGQGGDLGRVLQLRRGVRLRHRGRQDRRLRDDRSRGS